MYIIWSFVHTYLQYLLYPEHRRQVAACYRHTSDLMNIPHEVPTAASKQAQVCTGALYRREVITIIPVGD